MATEHETHKVIDEGIVLVPLTLAHPMSKAYAANARVEKITDYKVGDTVWVTREYGNALIDGGFVQVDPVDKAARQRALLLNHRNGALTVKEIERLLAKEAESDGVHSDGAADASTGAELEAATKPAAGGRAAAKPAAK